MTTSPDLHDHIVVFGFHGLGRRIVRQLAGAQQHVVVVDPDISVAEREDLARWGVQYLSGYGHGEDTLAAARVADAHAVMCVTGDDVANIRLALLVRDRSERVRLVVQMTNTSVGRALRSVAQPGAVLNVAELASTSFIEAAVRRTTHALDIGGQTFLMATVDSDTEGTLRSRWGDLAPVAVLPADGTPIVVCPGRDHRVHPGDRVTLIGTTAEYDRVGLSPALEQATVRGPSIQRKVRESLSAISDAVDRPFRIAFGVLAALAAVSITILTIGYREPDGTRMNVLDAVYFTSETIATVGFGDFYFRDQSPWLRVWAIVLVLMGATLVALATALFTNALISRRLEQSLGRQRLTGLQDHIVVIGLGAVGSRVAMDLHDAGYEVAVIDGGEGERFVPQMRAAGIPVLFGDATLAATQAAAGVQRAAGIAVLTSDDLVNIETGLAVRGAVGERQVPIVLRVFSRNLARVIGSGLDAGIARSIAELASPWFVGAALGLDVLGTFYIGSTPFVAARLSVHPGGGLDGVALGELGVRVRVVAVQHGDGSVEHPPRRDTLLRAGDTASVIGPYDELQRLLRRP